MHQLERGDRLIAQLPLYFDDDGDDVTLSVPLTEA